jgi:hypothetical protein
MYEWSGIINPSSTDDLYDEADNIDYSHSVSESPIINPHPITYQSELGQSEINWRQETKKLPFIHFYNKSQFTFETLVNHLSSKGKS